MDFHLPKVPHSWRELAKEIAIIVLGVLIALFFEQLVQEWDWRQKVQAADRAMRDELLNDDGPEIYVDAAIHPCIVSRLDAIRSAVESGKPRAEIAKLTADFWTPFYTYDSTAYTAAEASQVSFHFDPKQLYPFTQVYASMPIVNQINALQARDTAALKAFRRTGGAVSGEEADRVLGAVEALRSDDHTMWFGAEFIVPFIRSVGTLNRQYTQMTMQTMRRHYGSCVKDLPPDFPTRVPPDY
jgi:phage baseplate assembly protein W